MQKPFFICEKDIHTQDPAVRGWSYRTIYKMVQLYDTYSTTSFASLLAETDMKAYKHVVPFETAQMDDSAIVPFKMAQIYLQRNYVI